MSVIIYSIVLVYFIGAAPCFIAQAILCADIIIATIDICPAVRTVAENNAIFLIFFTLTPPYRFYAAQTATLVKLLTILL